MSVALLEILEYHEADNLTGFKFMQNKSISGLLNIIVNDATYKLGLPRPLNTVCHKGRGAGDKIKLHKYTSPQHLLFATVRYRILD